MISVQNPPLPLNGNKFKGLFIFLFIFSLLIIGCTASKKATKTVDKPKTEKKVDDDPVVYNPATKKYEKQSEIKKEEQKVIAKNKADSLSRIKKEPVVIKEKPKEVEHPLNYRQTVQKNSYNVVYLLPFMSSRSWNNLYDISNNSLWAIDFYSGSKMALQEMNLHDVQIHTYVIDSDVTDEEIQKQLKRPEVMNADLIIGPYKSSQAKLVSDFVKDKQINVVSPYTASSKASTENANYIQVNPSIGEHYQAIAEHLSKHYKPEQIHIVTRDIESEKSRANIISDNFDQLYESKRKRQIKQIVLPETFNLSAKFTFDSIMKSTDPAVFVVPSWDEAFVLDLLRKMDRDKNESNVIVYGMPLWQTFERCFGYYDRLNVTISSHVLVQPQDRGVSDFKSKYFDIYSKMPSIDCYSGYDITKYFIGKMVDYGNFFQAAIETSEQQGLITNFKIRPNISESNGKKIIDFYENKGIQILQFKGLSFKPYE